MPTVNTNSASTFALNKMNQTEREMLTAMERLSSGKRINHAGDDAAGGAIINQVNNGIASYGVNTGFFAAGCSAGPTQIYGLPVLLN